MMPSHASCNRDNRPGSGGARAGNLRGIMVQGRQLQLQLQLQWREDDIFYCVFYHVIIMACIMLNQLNSNTSSDRVMFHTLLQVSQPYPSVAADVKQLRVTGSRYAYNIIPELLSKHFLHAADRT